MICRFILKLFFNTLNNSTIQFDKNSVFIIMWVILNNYATRIAQKPRFIC